MRTGFALFPWIVAAALFGQTAQQCKQAETDFNFKPPAQMSEDEGTAIGPHDTFPLFFESGMDFYGLARKRDLNGKLFDESGFVWIVVVFQDEARREAEAQLLMQRIHNPHLNADYAEDLKFVLVEMRLETDSESAGYKAWRKCIHITSKCQYPPDVPEVWAVSYFRPAQCINNDPKAWGGYVLFFGRQWATTVPQSFQPSLVKAANLILTRFKAENGLRQSK